MITQSHLHENGYHFITLFLLPVVDDGRDSMQGSTKNKDGFLEVSVNDSGIGMNQQNLEKIFKIDSKFSNLGTNNEKGTGLGLILCKEFVELQGGKIWVTSKVGIGSTFTFTLPLAKK